jgi:hypothetical protein
MSVFDDIFKENFHINSPFSNPRASSWVKYTCSTRKSRGSYTSMRCCSRGIIQGLHARIYTTSLESSDWLLIELLSTSFPGLQCEDVLLWKIILQNILVHTRIIKIQMLNCYCQLSSSVIFRQYGVSQSECKIDRPRPGLPRVLPRPHTEALGTRLNCYFAEVKQFSLGKIILST